jgi:hypothetical protein
MVTMVMGGNQIYLRRQQTGVGWLVVKWLAYCQADKCRRLNRQPQETQRGDDNLGLGVLVIFLLVLGLPLLLL